MEGTLVQFTGALVRDPHSCNIQSILHFILETLLVDTKLPASSKWAGIVKKPDADVNFTLS